MWLLILKIFTAHLLGDFVFQTRKMVQNKHQIPYFVAHILIHALLLCMFLWNDALWWLILIIIITHAAIDWVKIKLTNRIKPVVLFIIDQLLHVFVIVLCLVVFLNLNINFLFLQHPQFWLLVTAIILLTQVTAIVIRILLSPYQDHKKITNFSAQPTTKNVLFNAGKYIGILERLFIFGFVLANFWEGIGFLLAAKSIFRFGDLNNAKERHLTEYVLIGTFLSFGSAIVVGLLFNYLKHIL